VLDARQAYRRTQAPGCVTSAAVRANPGLDYSPTEEPIDSRVIRRINGTVRSCTRFVFRRSEILDGLVRGLQLDLSLKF